MEFLRGFLSKKVLNESRISNPDESFHNILIIEHDDETANKLKEHLTQLRLQIDYVKNGQEAINCIKKSSYDLLLVDCQLPDMTNIVKQIKKSNVPFVVLARQADISPAVEMMKLGAVSCVITEEPFVGFVPHVVKNVLAAEEVEKEYSNLIENLPVGVYRSTPDGKGSFKMANLAMADMFGYESVEEFCKIPVSSIFADPSKREDQSDELKEKKQFKRKETYFKRKDGTYFWGAVTAQAIPETGEVQYFDGIIEDITEFKNLIEGLRTVVASAEELLNCPDLDSLYKRGVELARENLGVERCAIYIRIGDTWHGTFGTDMQRQTTDEHSTSFAAKNDPDIAEFLEAIRKKPERIHWKVYFDRPLKNQFEKQGPLEDIGKGWVAMTAIRIPSSENLEGTLFNDTAITNLDNTITEKKTVDETQQDFIAVYCALLGSLIAVKQAEIVSSRLKAWRDFSAHASHRIGNEISSVSMLLDVLAEQLIKDPNYAQEWTQKLSVMQGCIRASKKMLSDLTVLTARVTPQPKLTNLIELVRRASLGVLPEQANLNLKDLPPDIELRVDPDLMEQAFRELCTNAVRVTSKDLSLIVSAREEGNTIHISFQDTGPGIHSEWADRIFEPFVTFSAGRTGLGLATVRHIIEAHGGGIRLQESTVGAHFIISLPLGEQK